MEIEVITNYLPINEELNLNLYQIMNRKASNNAVEVMAKDLVQRYNVKPENNDIEKVIITLTANEEHIMDIKKSYVLRKK